jgi:GTP cyclohydrolase FolE2
MDATGDDIPNQAPSVPLGIQQIGVKREAIPVSILDPLGSGEIVHLSCAVEAQLSLPAHQRGIHVSRIGDELAKLTGRVFLSLQDYVAQLAELVHARQESDCAQVSARGTFSYLESISGVKAKNSLEHVELSAEAEVRADETRIATGLGFTHIAACPCVQKTYLNSFRTAKLTGLKGLGDNPMPLLTHSQRCRTWLTISDLPVGATPPLPELLACIDDVVIRSQNTLPREDELLNVFRAHQRAQFLEDILRDLIAAVYMLVRARAREGRLAVRSTSMESIHDFDLEGQIAYSLSELRQMIGAE